MLGRATGAVLVGIDARLIEVEVDLAPGLPTIAAVGLPDPAVREGIDRVRSALQHLGQPLPQRRIVVNLAPAEVRKHGSALDLPIAAALLSVAQGREHDRGAVLAGELALDATLRPVRGTLSIALATRAAGLRRLVVPADNAAEATLVGGLEVVAVRTLAEALAAVRGAGEVLPAADLRDRLRRVGAGTGASDLSDVRGQATARRALEIAAAGGHHLLLSGPPGTGKTMLARRLPGILPPLAPDEALEVTRIWSAAGLARDLVAARPFRAPHHGISGAAMTGGGRGLRPGEVTLASHGVLYLDEVTEFRRDALEALRQPIEDGELLVVRVHGSVRFPARFALVASMNPCPCGYHGDPEGRCGCTPRQIARYRDRVSGPLLDRFDLFVEVPPVDPRALAAAPAGEASSTVRARVVAARARQRHRLGHGAPPCNAMMGPRELARHARVDGEARRLLAAAGRRLGLSARGWDRVRRVARTIADLDGAPSIGARHVAEAVEHRRPGREEPGWR